MFFSFDRLWAEAAILLSWCMLAASTIGPGSTTTLTEAYLTLNPNP